MRAPTADRDVLTWAAPSVTCSRGSHPLAAQAAFGPTLDPFHDERLLCALFGSCWESTYVETGSGAMLHVSVPRQIGHSGRSDAVARIGYGGPLFTAAVTEPLAAYGAACRRRRLVAELIRFDPLARDDVRLAGVPGLRVRSGRQIVHVPLDTNDPETEDGYTPACRRRLRAGRRSMQFHVLGSSRDALRTFERIYYASIRRVGAAAEWALAPGALDPLELVDFADVCVVLRSGDDEPIAATLGIRAGPVAHSLLVASHRAREHPGAGELLTHGIAAHYAHRGCRWLCLGGGGTRAVDDPLLRFKRKFSGGNLHTLPVGLLVHDAAEFARLSGASERGAGVQIDPVVAELLPYRAVARYADPRASSTEDP